MMNYNIYQYNQTEIDYKPSWWTAERMDYCDMTGSRKYKKAARKFLTILVSMFV